MGKHEVKLNLTDKVVVVTGGGGGIGKAICETFAKAGATVYILDLNVKNADTVACEIKKKGKLQSRMHAM